MHISGYLCVCVHTVAPLARFARPILLRVGSHLLSAPHHSCLQSTAPSTLTPHHSHLLSKPHYSHLLSTLAIHRRLLSFPLWRCLSIVGTPRCDLPRLGGGSICCCWLHAACCWLLAAGCMLQAAGCTLHAAGCTLHAAGCQLAGWLAA